MKAMKCRLLTLDVWDTILRRRCHPDEIKVKTAEEFLHRFRTKCRWNASAKELAAIRIQCERKIGAANKRQGYDDEYEIHDVLKKWCRKISSADEALVSRMAEEMYQYELENEMRHAYLDTEIIKFLDRMQYEQLALVSDFYAGREFIAAILKACNFHKPIDNIYISCTCRCNKRSGKLFEYVHKKEGVDFKQWVHIGDNKYSDVEVPKRMGITAVHYMPKREAALREFRESQFSWKKTIPRRRAAGEHIEVFFFGFITWMMEKSVERGIEKLYFFTREGEFFKNLFDEVKKQHPFRECLPETYIAEVSRAATFLPSLREISIEEFMRIWNQYSVQSMEALFKSLGMDIAVVQKYLDMYQIPKSEAIQYPWQDTRVQELFLNQDFIKEITQERDRTRGLLCDYLAQKGFRRNTPGRIGIVDIGWRGTIQDNLCYIYPEYEIDGFYIGLIPFLSPQPENSTKKGYLDSCPQSRTILASVTPFEMLCNSPNGSTVGYQKDAGGIRAVRKKEKSEDAVYYSFVKNKQEEIIQKMQRYCIEIKEKGYMAAVYEKQAYRALYRFISFPDHKTVRAYFKLIHNEEFGLGRYVEIVSRFDLNLFVQAFLHKKGRRELLEFLRETTWPQGYFVKYHLYPFLWIYNWLLWKHSYKKSKEIR